MKYRKLGKAGVQVSELSFGSWVTFHNQAGIDSAVEMMSAAYEAGVNFFDNAEIYANGKSEEVMGTALKKLGWRRGSYLVSTKLFWGAEQRSQRAQHAQPQISDRRHQRLAQTPGPGLRRPDLLPPRRPKHAHRRDRLGHAQHYRMGQGALLGHVRMVGSGDRGRDRDRRTASPAQAGHGTAHLQYVRAPSLQPGI